MRKKAQDAGNLKSTPQIKVVQSSPQVIEIQTPSPQVVYVPTYNPQVVYVPAPPPPPAPSTGAVVAASLIGFAASVAITAAFSDGWWGYHGGFAWSSHTVIVHNSAWGRTWVNRGVYVHTWGGYNRSFYARPTAWVNNNVYVNRNLNVNRNVNVNVNRNVNVNQNLNVNRNVNQNINRTQNINQTQNLNRGYTHEVHSGSAYGGVSHGRSEVAASARGGFHRRR